MHTKSVKLEDCLSVTPSLAYVGIVGSGSSVGTKASAAIKEKQVDECLKELDSLICDHSLDCLI